MTDTISDETPEEEEWIDTKKAAEITELSVAQVQYLCKQYEETNGEKGLLSKRFSRIWQVSRQAAEEYERSNRGKWKIDDTN